MIIYTIGEKASISKALLYAIILLFSTSSFLVSCGSAKPKVVTTKKDARKYGSYTTVSKEVSAKKKSLLQSRLQKKLRHI